MDSRGNPTVETTILLDTGLSSTASVPSGASKGSFEAYELRDNDKSRYLGFGVLQAVKNITEIIKPKLIGFDPSRQMEIDNLLIELDGSSNKKNLGANSILSVSLACCRVAAKSLNIPLYKYIGALYGESLKSKQVIPLLNVINGGLHGTGNLKIQEFMLIPRKSALFAENFRTGEELYQLLKIQLKKNKLINSVGDEGGFTPNLTSDYEVLDLLKNLITENGYSYNSDISLGVDMAASTYYHGEKYQFFGSNLEKKQYLEEIIKMSSRYDLSYLEDAFFEDDWQSWCELQKRVGDKLKVVGDDLLVTNKERLEQAVLKKACNGIIIKVNQIGTLSETLDVVKTARNNNFVVIVSHRSAETNDDFIADLSVGVNSDYVKFGAPARGERVAKYNRLLEIYSDHRI